MFSLMRCWIFMSLATFLAFCASHGNVVRAVAAENQSSPSRDPHAANVTDKTHSAGSTRPVIADGYSNRPLAYDEVRPRGILADRVKLSLDKLIREQQMHTGYATWGADQIGRWIGAVAVLSAVSGQDGDQELRPKVVELIASQAPSGVYYGDKLAEDSSGDNYLRVWFGQGRALWNLLEYYRIAGDRRCLESLVRAADGTVADQASIKKVRTFWGDRESPSGISCGIESGMGAMVVLGQISGNKAYLDYARYIADNMPIHVGTPSSNVRGGLAPTELVKFDGTRNEHHTHSYLSIAHGLVDLFVATGEQKYLDQAKTVFDDTLPSVWINGDIPEGYGQVFEHRDEICSAVDWTLLALKLFDATGDAKYLDAAELTSMNQLFQGQDVMGGFTCYRCVDRRHWMDEKNYGGVHQACCSMHGGLLLGYVAAHVVTEGSNGLSVNLPFDVDVNLKNRDAKITQRIDVQPQVLTQRIEVANRGAEPLPLKIRIPYWCNDPAAKVNGKTHALAVSQGFAEVECVPDATTEIVVSLPMKLAIIPARTNTFTKSKGPVAGPADELGLQYGPFVLMLFREMYPDIKERDVSVTIPLDDLGHPLVSLDPPPKWRSSGAYNIFLKARANGKEITLTPCANTAMAQFTVSDPYVLRFAEVEFNK